MFTERQYLHKSCSYLWMFQKGMEDKDVKGYDNDAVQYNRGRYILNIFSILPLEIWHTFSNMIIVISLWYYTVSTKPGLAQPL